MSDGIAQMRSQGKRLLVSRDAGDRQLNNGQVMVWAGGRGEKGADLDRAKGWNLSFPTGFPTGIQA